VIQRHLKIDFSTLRWLEKLQEEEGIPIPELQPPLFPDLVKYLNAFWFLSESRPKYIGMTQLIDAPILPSEIEAYFQLHYITDLEERLDYIRFIKVLDRSYLKHQADNRPDPEDEGDNQGKRKRNK